MTAFFSVEVVEASVRYGRRLRFTNRHSGSQFFRPFPPGLQGRPISEQMKDAVLTTYTTPLATPKVLWWDERLKMLFYELVVHPMEQ